MAQTFKRILVALRDPRMPSGALLRKASTIAEASGARVELFHAINEPIPLNVLHPEQGASAVDAERASIARLRTQQLEKLARKAFAQNVRVTTHAEWDFPPHEAVIRRALAIRADLVIAGVQPPARGGRVWLANTDWELIRHCPCPLLLVKSPRAYDRPKVLVAVDPFHAHDKPASLDSRLLKAGAALSNVLRGELHLFHAYMPLVANMLAPSAQMVPAWGPPGAQDQYIEEIRTALDKLARQEKIPPARRHLVAGDVVSALTQTVKRVGARVVVMGAVSRRGLRRIFIGNTAERALDQIAADVLVVKPRGFKTDVPQGVLRR